MSKQNGVPPMWQFALAAIIVFVIFAVMFGGHEIIAMIKNK